MHVLLSSIVNNFCGQQTRRGKKVTYCFGLGFLAKGLSEFLDMFLLRVTWIICGVKGDGLLQSCFPNWCVKGSLQRVLSLGPQFTELLEAWHKALHHQQFRPCYLGLSRKLHFCEWSFHWSCWKCFRSLMESQRQHAELKRICNSRASKGSRSRHRPSLFSCQDWGNPSTHYSHWLAIFIWDPVSSEPCISLPPFFTVFFFIWYDRRRNTPKKKSTKNHRYNSSTRQAEASACQQHNHHHLGTGPCATTMWRKAFSPSYLL